MPTQFNSYIDNIDTDFWQDLCKNRGHLRHYDKGEAFITAGEVGRYIGYVESGALKMYAIRQMELTMSSVLNLQAISYAIFPARSIG